MGRELLRPKNKRKKTLCSPGSNKIKDDKQVMKTGYFLTGGNQPVQATGDT